MWFKTNVKDCLCYIPVDAVHRELGGKMSQALKAFHAITADYVPPAPFMGHRNVRIACTVKQ